MGCALVVLFQVRSLYIPTKTGLPLQGHFWESLVFRLHSKLARSILALKLSVTTTVGSQEVIGHTIELQPLIG